MTARTRHLARPGDLTGPESAVDVLCGTLPRRHGDSLWATETEAEVTCKKCLKVLADIAAEKQAEGLERAEYWIGKALEDAERIVADEADRIVEEDTVPMDEFRSLYTTDVYLAPTGPLVERHDVVIPNTFDDRAIAERHGLQRFEVENAINDGWLKR